jgi:hypothetical protein
MAQVTLKNPRKEVFLFTLYHSVYCGTSQTCACDKQRVLRQVQGGVKYVDIVNPVGVHLEGGTSQSFDAAVLNIQPVGAAVKSGRLLKVEAENKTETLKK